MSPHTKWKTSTHSCILHCNWLLLFASEAGVPLYAGVCQVWDRCISPTPVKPTLEGSNIETMPQEDNGLVITQLQARKSSLGWINRKLWLLPWTSARVSTEDGWRFHSRHGHLLQPNGQQDCMHLVEGWTSTCRCQQIADWMTTMTAHKTGMWLLFIVGSSSTLMWNTAAQPPEGPMPPTIWWLNFFTSPVWNWTKTHCDYAGTRACPEISWGEGPYGVALPKLKFFCT